jgi:hypothetical protein
MFNYMTKSMVEEIVGEPIDNNPKALDLLDTLNTIIGAIVPTGQEEELAAITKMNISDIRGATLDTILEAAALYYTQLATLEFLRQGVVGDAIEQFRCVLSTLKR